MANYAQIFCEGVNTVEEVEQKLRNAQAGAGDSTITSWSNQGTTVSTTYDIPLQDFCVICIDFLKRIDPYNHGGPRFNRTKPLFIG